MMTHNISLYERHQNSLNNLKRQKNFTAKYELPLIIIKTNIPYELTTNSYNNFVYQTALQTVTEKLAYLGISIIEQDTLRGSTNLESIIIVKGSTASQLKRIMTGIENEHPLGRLINIDVTNSQGILLSRKAAQMEPRRCLLCHCPASYCATNHHHSVQALENKIKEIIEQDYPDEMSV